MASYIARQIPEKQKHVFKSVIGELLRIVENEKLAESIAKTKELEEKS